MATKFKLIRSIEYIHSTPEGEIDFEKSKELLAEIAQAKKTPADYDIILDFRRSQFNMTTYQIYKFAKELASYKDAFKDKIAVMVLPGLEFDKAEFFEYCSKHRGLKVEVFTNYEDAVEWFFKYPKKQD
jgi:hypothetical protein